MTNEPDWTPTAENLIAVIQEYVRGTRYRPGIIRQLMAPAAYIETPAGKYPGHVLLDAVLNVVEGMGRAGVSGADIKRASNTEFQTAGPEAASLMPYTGGIVWLASEEDEEMMLYRIGTDTAIAEIIMTAADAATDLDREGEGLY